jgi:hypothetical protein
MTAFKAIATLILISVIGLALLMGPVTDIGGGEHPGKEAPGLQSPAEPVTLPASPAVVLVLLALVGLPMMEIGRRVVGDY